MRHLDFGIVQVVFGTIGQVLVVKVSGEAGIGIARGITNRREEQRQGHDPLLAIDHQRRRLLIPDSPGWILQEDHRPQEVGVRRAELI